MAHQQKTNSRLPDKYFASSQCVSSLETVKMEGMSQWQKLQSLPGDGIRAFQQLYLDVFPIDIRYDLAPWIEQQPWQELDPDNPQHDQFASSLVAQLINLVKNLEIKANSEDNLLARMKYSEASIFLTQYSNNHWGLINTLKHLLQQEMSMLQQQHSACMDTKENLRSADQQITLEADMLKKRSLETEEETRTMQQEQEQFVLQIQEYKKIVSYLQQANNSGNGQNNIEVLTKLQKDKETYDNLLNSKASMLLQQRTKWVDKHTITCQSVNELQKRILETELNNWKSGQQLAGNGALFDNNLEKIQVWCECLADIIWQNHQQIKRVENLCDSLPLNSGSTALYMENLRNLGQQDFILLKNLVEGTFIIEKQPPQVMKTNTRFTSTVRLLVGNKLNVHMTPPIVTVSIISEAQANALKKNEKIVRESSGDILNQTGPMELIQSTKQLSVNFRNMQLRKIKRTEKKGTESVMNEQFALLFQSEFGVGGGVQFKTLSLPVVVIVHGNQEPHAWATVTWDNAFAEPGRAPFFVPDKVPFEKVGNVLSMKFKSQVGRELDKDSLHFLGVKAFRSNTDSDLLSWALFSKEPLPDRNFTFWEWFYAILKLTKDYLKELWKDGSIIGFVGKKQAEDMLLQMPIGTFLLRYSDSELGDIAIAWVAQGQNGLEVFNLQPFTSRDLQIRSLADRINDLKNLVYLYPDKPKDSVFDKYYTRVPDQMKNGYVKPVLVQHIPGLTNNFYDSNPNTPLSVIHNPNSPGDNTCCSFNDQESLRSTMTTDYNMTASGDPPNFDDLLLDIDGLPDIDTTDMDFVFSST